MKTELLAPAGDIEAGYAAIAYGANAVYLGLKSFSARANAGNFSKEELNCFVGYAHAKNVRVFVAINTLVKNDEIFELCQTLDACVACNVDAVILQDIGVLRIIKNAYPELEVHASTQMTTHNVYGAMALQKMGFERVVLARELNLQEIKDIAKIKGLELEVFVHGAMCYSYSGLCMLSAMEGMGSANRGRCASPCRLFYDKNGKSGHCFSMRDMALGKDVLKLGVASLKIEGRKKNAQYVAAVTDYYRNILDNNFSGLAKKEDNIKQIFSRHWSKFNFLGKNKQVIDSDYVGHRGLKIGKILNVCNNRIVFCTNYDFELRDGIQIEAKGQEKPFGFSVQNMQVRGKNVFKAKAGDEVSLKIPPSSLLIEKGMDVYLASSAMVKNSYDYYRPKDKDFEQKAKINISLRIFENKVVASHMGYKSEIEGDFVEAQNTGNIISGAQKIFAKTGDYDFDIAELDVENKNNLFVPASILNELRRSLYNQIKFEQKLRNLPIIDEPMHKKTKQKLIVKISDFDNLAEIDFDKIYELVYVIDDNIDIELLKNLPKDKLRLGLAAVCKNMDKISMIIKELVALGYHKWEVAGYWGIEALLQYNLDISFDSSIYVFNLQAMQMAKELGATRVTLCLENDASNLNLLAKKSPLPVVLPIYENKALFVSDVCLRDNSCSNCPKDDKYFEVKRAGKKYMALSKNCQTIMFADKPINNIKQAKNIMADFYLIDFCYRKYCKNEIKSIIESYTNHD